MEARHETTRIIDPVDIDELGHVNNVAWVRFIVELAADHSEAVGLDLATYRKIGGLWVVRRHEVTYLGSAGPGDRVTGATWIESLRGARCFRRARFADAGDATLVESRTEWAFVNADTMRPMRVPAAVTDRFPPVPAVAPVAAVAPDAPSRSRRG